MKLLRIAVLLALCGVGLTAFAQCKLPQASAAKPAAQEDGVAKSIYLTASLALGAVGFLSCYVPALRATRVDPLVVLRYQ